MNDERDTVREALRGAADEPAPDVDRLVHAVPRMMAEARRRTATASPLTGVAPLAASVIPRLAAAAAVLVLLTVAIAWRDLIASDSTGQDIDSVILGGSDAAAVESLLNG
jgi:hypothetical protein